MSDELLKRAQDAEIALAEVKRTLDQLWGACRQIRSSAEKKPIAIKEAVEIRMAHEGMVDKALLHPFDYARVEQAFADALTAATSCMLEAFKDARLFVSEDEVLSAARRQRAIRFGQRMRQEGYDVLARDRQSVIVRLEQEVKRLRESNDHLLAEHSWFARELSKARPKRIEVIETGETFRVSREDRENIYYEGEDGRTCYFQRDEEGTRFRIVKARK